MKTSKSTLGLFKIMESLSNFRKLTVIGNLISAEIEYFEIIISIFCFEHNGDLVVILTTEPEQVLVDKPEQKLCAEYTLCGSTEKLFSESNHDSNRGLENYEKKFLYIVSSCRTKGSISATLQDYSFTVKIYGYNENFSLTNFFYVFNDLDFILLGEPV